MPSGIYERKKGYKGKPLSEDRKKHLSEFWKGKKKSKLHTLHISEAKKGRKNPNFGKSPSEETLKKRSIALKGKLSGSKNPMYGKPSWNKGLTQKNDERVKKIADIRRGIKRPNTAGEKSPNWKGGHPKCVDCGVTLSNYVSKRCSKCDGINMRGSKCHLWQGGKSYEPYTVDWNETLKRAIRERDNYICQICSKYGNAVHHIDYDKKNCCPNNLVNLCRSCNARVNHNRDYWTEFFKNLMLGKNNG